MEFAYYFLAIFILGVLLDVWIIRIWRRARARRKGLSDSEFGDNYPRDNQRVGGVWMPRIQQITQPITERLLKAFKRGNRWQALTELLVIAGWTLWLCRGYFTNFEKFTWPIGREFGVQVYSHHFWMDLLRCGSCALWNGSINGGAPALGDPFGSAFHPIVMLATLFFGVVNGVKMATIFALWLAGFSQWWIARTLDAGWLARLWSAMLAVVGGHLLGRLELGAFGLALSMSSISLVLASAFWLAKSRSRRAAIVLAVAAALALLAGHGYLQLGLLALAPAFLFLVLDNNWKFQPVWRNFLLAGVLGILLAGFFLIPVLHFAPNIEKFTEPAFESAQPMEYIPLNLVIRDWDFYNNATLGKYPFPYLYNLFIGWFPVLLAILSLYFLRQEKRTILFVFGTGILILFFVASGIPFRWLVKIFPVLAGVRHVPLIAGLLVPLFLGLAAATLDEIFNITWPDLSLVFGKSSPGITLSLRWLLLIPAIWSISLAYNFNKAFLMTAPVDDVYTQVQAVPPAGLHWAEVPFGEHWWVEPALDSGWKLTNVVMPWWWKNRETPQPYLMARSSDEQTGEKLDQTLGETNIYLDIHQQYAAVESGEQVFACQASGWGGQIAVVCNAPEAGSLIVRENMWSGWKAWMNGERVQLIGKDWLKVKSPAGEHSFQFRYQPWDVRVGVFLSMIGVLLSIYFWRATPEDQPPRLHPLNHEREPLHPPQE